jgi:hypothetical protein
MTGELDAETWPNFEVEVKEFIKEFRKVQVLSYRIGRDQPLPVQPGLGAAQGQLCFAPDRKLLRNIFTDIGWWRKSVIVVVNNWNANQVESGSLIS